MILVQFYESDRYGEGKKELLTSSDTNVNALSIHNINKYIL